MPDMGGHPALTWSTGFSQWMFSPVVTAALLVIAGLYGWGVLRSVRRRGRSWPAIRVGSFAAGLVVVAIATQSSIGVYERDLFWVHMIQHLLLIMLAPALLVTGRPWMLLLHTGSPGVHRITKRALRSAPVSLLTHPVVAAAIYTVTVLITHLTGFMDTLMSSSTAHGGEQLLYLVAGYLYFLPVFGDEPIRWRLSHPMKIALLVVSMPVDTFTGVALMQSNAPRFGMPLSDIRNGGAVMWIGGDFLMFVAILVVFAFWAQHDTARGAARRGWMEAARASVFTERAASLTAGSGPAGAAESAGSRAGSRADTRPPDLDNDDEQLVAYNSWLAKINGGEQPTPKP
jgi:putative copper resistance protein D